MPTLTPNAQLSFLELAKRTGETGMIDIVEVMNARAPILEDIPWFQSNQIMSEKILRRATLPSGSYRQAYNGTSKEASTTQLTVESVALLEARSETDEALVDNAPNPDQFRRDEDLAFVEGLAQTFAKNLIDGDEASSPEEFNGLRVRLNDLNQRTVIGAGGGSGNTTSIYIVDWGRRKTYGIYPAAAQNRGPLGLTAVNKGKEPVQDGNSPSRTFYAHVTQFIWWHGLAVRDEIAIGRYCNIEVSGATNIFNEDHLIELLNEGHFNRATTRMYFNQKIKTQAQIRLKDKTNINWTAPVGLSGVPMLVFDGVITRQMEDNIITNTETEVVAV